MEQLQERRKDGYLMEKIDLNQLIGAKMEPRYLEYNDSLTPGEPERMTRMAAAMSSPLLPGTPVETHIWKMGDRPAYFRPVDQETGKAVLNRGEFEWK